MTSLKLVALNVHPNEGALMLAEVNKVDPSFKQMRRLQFIKVVRGDKVLTYEQDLGPAENFIGNQFHIPGGAVDEVTGKGNVWHSVGELQGMAEELRHRDSTKWAEDQGYDMTVGSPSEWQDEYLKEADRRKMAASKKSISGAHFSTTR